MTNTDVDPGAGAQDTSTVAAGAKKPDAQVDPKAAGAGADAGKPTGDAGAKPAAAAAGNAAAGSKPAAEAEPVSVWPKDWRERAAEAVAPKDTPEYKKAFRRLERYADPTAVGVKALNLEEKLSSGLIKVPGPKSTPEEVAEYREAIGVPKTAEEYIPAIKLPEGKVLGEADQPMVGYFAKIAHEAGVPPSGLSAVIAGYLDWQEEQTAETYKRDRAAYGETHTALGKEWGAAKDTNIAVIATLFTDAPGGPDPKNQDSFMSQLLAARLPNGNVLGNDATAVKMLSAWALGLNPAATIVPDGKDARISIGGELDAMRKLMAKQDSEYWVGPNAQKNQARMAELLSVKERLDARGAR